MSFVMAVAVHAALLFAFRSRDAKPLAPTDEPSAVEVTLEAGPPEAAAALPAAAPPESAVQPPPKAVPVPEPKPQPEMAKPALTPEPLPEPEPKPKPPERPKPARPSIARAPASTPTAVKGPSTAAATGAANRGAANTSARPRYRSNPKPEYPAEAKRARQQGVVLLLVDVTAEGRVSDLRLSRSSGFPTLDQAAMAAVRHWTFEPALAMGLPVPSRPEVPVRFSLGP